jgi:hypothetical protein
MELPSPSANVGASAGALLGCAPAASLCNTQLLTLPTFSRSLLACLLDRLLACMRLRGCC